MGWEDEWIVQVQFGGEVLSPDFGILVSDEAFYLPLIGLARLLFIPFEHEKGGIYRGRVDETSGEITLEPDTRKLDIGGERTILAAGDVVVLDDEVFVRSTAASRILAVQAVLDRRSLHLRLTAERPLPIQVMRQRERLREQLLSIAEKDAATTESVRDVPYALLSPPVGDVNLRASHSSTDRLRYGYAAILAGEVGYLSSTAFLSGDENNGLRDARLTLGRADPTGGVFGLAPLTQAFAGDVNSPAMPLVGSSGLGRGVILDTRPLDQPDEFDRTSIEGDGPPGWTVELYRNQVLLGFEEIGTGGRFAFNDVPLVYGVNLVRLVFYGPQGQRREEDRRLVVGAGSARAGETQFRAFIGEPGSRLFGPVLSNGNPDSELGYALEMKHGFTANVSLGAFATRSREGYGTGSPMSDYVGADAQFSFGQVMLDAKAVQQVGAGYAGELGVFGSFDGVSVSARHARFVDYRSPASSLGMDPLDAITSIRMNMSVPDGLPVLGGGLVSLRGERRDFTEKGTDYVAGVDLWHGAERLSIAHGLDLTLSEAANGEQTDSRITYTPAVSYRSGNLSVRGTATLDPAEPDPFRRVAAGATYRFDERTTASLSGSYSLADSSRALSASVSTDLGPFFLNGFAGLREGGAFNIGIGAVFSFGFDRNYRPYVTSDRLATTGAVAPFVYFDADANGQFEPETDRALEGVGFQGKNSRPLGKRTDSKGELLLTQLSTVRPLTLAVDEGTLEDPFWVPTHGPITVQPRSGRSFTLEIPIVEGGEISGTISGVVGNSTVPVEGVRVNLITLDDRPVAEARSFGDGFYLFEKVPPGTYVLTVADGQKLEGVTLMASERIVVVRSEMLVRDGEDFRYDLAKGSVLPRPGSQFVQSHPDSFVTPQ